MGAYNWVCQLFDSQMHSLPFLVLFYITKANPADSIVQAPLPSDVFMGLTNGGKGRRWSDPKQREARILHTLFALGGSLSSGWVSSLTIAPA